MSCVAVIPARYASERLPGKALMEVSGLPLVVHVARRVAQSSRVDRVIVATDDARICDAVARHGGEAWMTQAGHRCGTERVAEVAASLDARVILNVQGDEPLIDPGTIDAVVACLDDPSVQVATPVTPFPDGADPRDSNRVKAVVGDSGNVLYFSRQPIPTGGPWWLHIGVYGFQAAMLRSYSGWPQTALERSERLEQLRFLAHGVSIRGVSVMETAGSVDTPSDFDAFRDRFMTSSSQQQRH